MNMRNRECLDIFQILSVFISLNSIIVEVVYVFSYEQATFSDCSAMILSA